MPYHLAMSPCPGAEHFPFPHKHMHTSSPVLPRGQASGGCLQKNQGAYLRSNKNGAGDGARTRYLHLGKVALYQMSYARMMRSR